jgi:hypothetical protein
VCRVLLILGFLTVFKCLRFLCGFGSVQEKLNALEEIAKGQEDR